MAERKARLRIVSRMTDTEGEVYETKNARGGTFEETADGVRLAYIDAQDGERAQVRLTATPTGAQMRRVGDMTGTLNFVPGQRTPGVYATAYGEIPVAVFTRGVALDRQENGGELRLDYDVFIGGERTSSAQMTVTWRL